MLLAATSEAADIGKDTFAWETKLIHGKQGLFFTAQAKLACVHSVFSGAYMRLFVVLHRQPISG